LLILPFSYIDNRRFGDTHTLAFFNGCQSLWAYNLHECLVLLQDELALGVARLGLDVALNIEPSLNLVPWLKCWDQLQDLFDGVDVLLCEQVLDDFMSGLGIAKVEVTMPGWIKEYPLKGGDDVFGCLPMGDDEE
jgi:hypothetical protein